MAGGKVSARQKMINMMYLVLTALLALNVSKEIIKSFNLMENSLATSTASIAQKNDKIKLSIAKEAEQGNAGAAAAGKHYESLHKLTDVLTGRIEGIKKELLKLTEGRKPSPDGELVKGGLNELTQGDNMEVHGNYFDVQDGGKNGKDLQVAINATRDQMLAILDKAIADPALGGQEATKKFLINKRDAIKSKATLFAQDSKDSEGNEQKWVSMYLVHSPLAGVFALLTKIENDALSMESEIAQALAESVGASSLKFDSVIPVIRAATSAVLTNQTYEADIILAAYDSKADMKMTVNGSPVEVKEGKGKYKASSSSPGEYTFKVGITIPKPGGGTEVVMEEGKYSVFAPSAAISADELNVIYEGLPNPLSITVAGVNPKDVNVSITSPGGDVTLMNTGSGKYEARCPVRKGNECFVNVNAKIGDRVVPMGTKRFKIRRVPRPTFMVGPIDFSGLIKLSILKAQSTCAAVLENFVYDGVKYVVVGYKFTALGKRTGFKEQNVQGASLAPISGMIGQLSPGDFIQFSEIRAMGPGGQKYLQNASGSLQ